MSKKTIAVIVREKNGVSFYRQLVPHSALPKDEFEVLLKFGVEEITDDEWKRISLIHFSGIFDYQREHEIRKRGIKIVLDKDDSWEIPATHPKAYEWQLNKYWYRTELSISAADHIICTTPHLASKCQELNHNVTVIPNAINPAFEMYKPYEWNVDPDFIRFGWLGGTSHLHDLMMLKAQIKKLDEQKEFSRKWQFVLAGFSMTETELNVEAVNADGTITKKAIPPYETIWGQMERAVTDNYRIMRDDKEYLNYISKFTQAGWEIMEKKIYKRIWGQDLFKYFLGYNEMDVVLAPLVNDEFNKCKSQLKLIEAGFAGRPVICSDIEPYRIDGEHERNCFMVKQDRPLDWYIYMRRFMKDPSLIKQMGAELQKDMMAKYHIRVVNQTRIELYRHLLK